MSSYCIWPDDTVCSEEELEGFLTFMSDDFVRVRIADDVECDDDYDVLPCYDEAFTLPRGRDGIYEITGVI